MVLGVMGVYSDMHREDATRSIALRNRIEDTGDTDLMRLMEERDFLFMESEGGKEIRGEWAAQARELVDRFTPDAKHSCACDVCAITHGLTAALAQSVRAVIENKLKPVAQIQCAYKEGGGIPCPEEWPSSPEVWCGSCLARDALEPATSQSQPQDR